MTCLEPGADELKRLLPERAIWQVCHDISRGLWHIHSHGMVHYDIKPSNIFFVSNIRLGTICKIGDFGLAGDIGTVDDGQEGDTAYMPNELLTSCAKHPGADIFSLGLTLYELAAAVSWSLPREGDRWHDLRNGSHKPNIPDRRSKSLIALIQSMLDPDPSTRPSAEVVSEHADVKPASALSDSFLSQYVKDVERYDSMRERDLESAEREARRR
jgi:serine/threonine protein kinase